MDYPKCPKCDSEYVYSDGTNLICPDCFFEFTEESLKENTTEYKDAVGNILKDGDCVIVNVDVKINGSSTNVIKRGTKTKQITLGDYKDSHDIKCKIDEFGYVHLKTSVVKKA